MYRPYNMKDCARRPPRTYSNDFASMWKFDGWSLCILVYFDISCQEICAGSILHYLKHLETDLVCSCVQNTWEQQKRKKQWHLGVRIPSNRHVVGTYLKLVLQSYFNKTIYYLGCFMRVAAQNAKISMFCNSCSAFFPHNTALPDWRATDPAGWTPKWQIHGLQQEREWTVRKQ